MTAAQPVIMSVSCPVCKVPAGNKCRLTIGRRRLTRTNPHEARIERYRKVAARKTGRRAPRPQPEEAP